MKTIKRIASALSLTGALGVTGVGAAAAAPASYPSVHSLLAQAAAPKEALKQASGEGEVRRVDKAGARLTIRHGDLKEIDMPPMTMVFQVVDPALLNDVKVGDRIRFTATSDAGRLTVTSLQIEK